jgi:hypothetical protein
MLQGMLHSVEAAAPRLSERLRMFQCHVELFWLRCHAISFRSVSGNS